MTNTTVKIIIRNTVAIARSRGVKWMGTTMLLHALRNSFSEAGRILRYDAGLTDEDTNRVFPIPWNFGLLDGDENGQQFAVGVLDEDFRRMETLVPVVELFLRKTGVLSAFRVES